MGEPKRSFFQGHREILSIAGKRNSRFIFFLTRSNEEIYKVKIKITHWIIKTTKKAIGKLAKHIGIIKFESKSWQSPTKCPFLCRCGKLRSFTHHVIRRINRVILKPS